MPILSLYQNIIQNFGVGLWGEFLDDILSKGVLNGRAMMLN